MASIDPVIERIEAYPWPRGGVSVRKLHGGYSLSASDPEGRPAHNHSATGGWFTDSPAYSELRPLSAPSFARSPHTMRT